MRETIEIENVTIGEVEMEWMRDLTKVKQNKVIKFVVVVFIFYFCVFLNCAYIGMWSWAMYLCVGCKSTVYLFICSLFVFTLNSSGCSWSCDLMSGYYYFFSRSIWTSQCLKGHRVEWKNSDLIVKYLTSRESCGI